MTKLEVKLYGFNNYIFMPWKKYDITINLSSIVPRLLGWHGNSLLAKLHF
jgi:hypothetical protein